MALQEGEEGVKLLLNLHLHVVVKQLNGGDGLELVGQGAVLRGVVICPRFNRVEVMDTDVLILGF